MRYLGLGVGHVAGTRGIPSPLRSYSFDPADMDDSEDNVFIDSGEDGANDLDDIEPDDEEAAGLDSDEFVAEETLADLGEAYADL